MQPPSAQQMRASCSTPHAPQGCSGIQQRGLSCRVMADNRLTRPTGDPLTPLSSTSLDGLSKACQAVLQEAPGPAATSAGDPHVSIDVPGGVIMLAVAVGASVDRGHAGMQGVLNMLIS